MYEGPRHRDGSPSWRILDPVRNRFFEVGWLEFELLARWSEHENAEGLLEQVSAETPLRPSDDELAGFITFLIDNQLLAPDRPEITGALRRRWLSAEKPWYERLFHNYLFLRIPLVRPDRFLGRTLPFAEIFYTKAFAVVVLIVFAADLYLLTREWDELKRSFLYFFNLEGGLYFLLAASFSKVIHELAHAYTAKRYGVRVPAMGVAFLVMWPFLYTDTGETWKLSDRRKQLAIASAGIVSELVLAVLATLLWSITPDGTMKNVLFILATTTWVITLAINASPFMRFDGYFVVSDALDFPNLHERSFGCARWWLRTKFFRLDEPLPEPTLSRRQRNGLIAFALGVWLYRFTLFLGIALLVYHTFYKPLGVLLMLLEVWWFIVRPIGKEAGYVWARRRQARLALGPLGLVIAAAMLVMWLIPVANEVSAPAVMSAHREQTLYAPFAARIASVEAASGQTVAEGQLLVRLHSPELEVRARTAEAALRTARTQYVRGAATTRQQERVAVLTEQVSQAAAERQAVDEDMQRLALRALGSGVVRDLRHEIVPGRWIGPRELILRVVSPQMTIEAYVSDSQIDAVEIGQEVTFFPALAGAPVIRGRVRTIDPGADKNVSRPLLAAPYGGDIPAVVDKKGAVVAQNANYRVLIEPEEQLGGGSVVKGTVRIRTNLWLVAENFAWRTLSLIVRESGI